jgi:hypothetical protein
MIHTILHVAKYIAILFAGGLATSYAEYLFQYSLYQTIAALFGKKFPH